MNSVLTESFLRRFDRFPERDKKRIRKAYRLFMENPRHPSLHFEKLHGFEDLWSVRGSLDLRVVGRWKEDAVVWFWIGTHAEFDGEFA